MALEKVTSAISSQPLGHRRPASPLQRSALQASTPAVVQRAATLRGRIEAGVPTAWAQAAAVWVASRQVLGTG